MSNKNQGEGNREASRSYNKQTREFIESGGVDENKHKHTQLNEADLAAIEKAAEEAKKAAK